MIIGWNNSPSTSPQRQRPGPSTEETALWAALAEISLCPRKVEPLGHFVTEFNEEGKQVITIDLRANDADIYNCSAVDSSDVERLQDVIISSQEDPRINHALTLLSLSANESFDDVRTFHITWVAFELFVEVLSAEYKDKYSKAFFSPIGTGDFALIQKYLIDKAPKKERKKFSKIMVGFVWIAACLDSSGADADFVEVESVRQFRNNFIHESPQSNDSATSHTQTIRDMLRKYSFLHLITSRA
jgi:hypothetical protein